MTHGRSAKCTASGGLRYLAGSLIVLTLAGYRAREPVSAANVDPSDVATHSRNEARPIIQEGLGEQTFHQQCVPCHGEKGRGDGPAAVAFNPRPADFTDPNGVRNMTDDSIAAVIAEGRASMPAYGEILSDEVQRAVVAYIRALSVDTDR